MSELDTTWTGRPEDKPGREERDRNAAEFSDAVETARNLNVSLLDVQEWDGRLTVRTIRPAYVVPPQSPEEQEAARAANARGLVNLREQSGLSEAAWAERFT